MKKKKNNKKNKMVKMINNTVLTEEALKCKINRKIIMEMKKERKMEASSNKSSMMITEMRYLRKRWKPTCEPSRIFNSKKGNRNTEKKENTGMMVMVMIIDSFYTYKILFIQLSVNNHIGSKELRIV